MATDRYSPRKNADDTWSIVDIFADVAVVVDGQVMMQMDEQEAGELVDLLNTIDRQRRHVSEEVEWSESRAFPTARPPHQPLGGLRQ